MLGDEANYQLFRVLREATEKTKDGRIDQTDFLNHASSSSRYNLFTPMEASIIFHFAGRGAPGQRLALIDFAQLLDPRWKAPGEQETHPVSGWSATSVLANVAESAYNFVQGGMCFVSISPGECKLICGALRFCGCIWSHYCLPYRPRYVVV